jgi:hypothetical protein
VNQLSNKEDYLDSLLNSVTEQPVMVKNKSTILETEEDFLQRFDEEMADVEDSSFLDDFDSELSSLIAANQLEKDPEMSEDFEGLVVNTMDQQTVSEVEPDPLLESELDQGELEVDTSDLDALLSGAREQIKGAAELSTNDSEMPIFSPGDDLPDEEDDVLVNTMPSLGDSKESDLLEGEGSDILNLLANVDPDDELENIGEMLRENDSDKEVLSKEEVSQMSGFDNMSLEELAELESIKEKDDLTKNEEDDDEDEGKKKKKRKKKKQKAKDGEDAATGDEEEKGGFLHNFSKVVFGEDEEEVEKTEEEIAKEDKAKSEKALAKEAKKKEKQEAKQAKKEEQNKSKEEKKQLKAEKKAAKLAAKPPKEAQPKGKPLPRGPVILITIMAASICLLVNLLTSLSGYTVAMKNANSEFKKGSYVGAFAIMSGMKIKKADELFYEKVKLVAVLQKDVNSYVVFHNKGKHLDALNALVSGVGKYEAHIDEAKAMDVAKEYEEIKVLLTDGLKEYKIKFKGASEIYRLATRQEYSTKLNQIIDKAGLAEVAAAE